MASNSALIIPPAPPGSVTNDIRAIKPPVEIASGWSWLWWSFTLVAVAAALFFLWRWWRQRQQVLAAAVPRIPPHVRARQKLQEALLLIHDPGPFCVLVSDTIRIYLEERFDLRAPERTTEEFLGDLQSTRHLNSEQKEGLRSFLERCDLVKFARDEPHESVLRELHESALRLVDETQFEKIQPSEPTALSSPPGAGAAFSTAAATPARQVAETASTSQPR